MPYFFQYILNADSLMSKFDNKRYLKIFKIEFSLQLFIIVKNSPFSAYIKIYMMVCLIHRSLKAEVINWPNSSNRQVVFNCRNMTRFLS